MATDRARRAGPLALTMGDPAGIGIEIALIAWRDRAQEAIPPFAIFADPAAVVARAEALAIRVPIESLDTLARVAEAFSDRLPVRPVRLATPAEPGRPDSANAGAIIRSIEEAAMAVMSGEASALVTSPIAKSVLYDGGFDHPGHTEFLGRLAERREPGRRFRPVMMLASDELKVVPLTVHIPLSEVARSITGDAIRDTARIVLSALREDFGLDAPRLAVAGLNPHAGESGTLGREEEETIAPAVRALRAEGLSVTGPHSADTLFHEEARSRYDAVLAMYHDQALIPLKTLAFDRGVNVTLGLPFVRTSPDHGTAFDIAGTGKANPKSLIASLNLAAAIAARRAKARAGAGP
jgi:4-hydroxythreonine-4-phosphate dehydrogenase